MIISQASELSIMISTVSIDSAYKKIIQNAEKHYQIRNLALEALKPEALIKLLQKNEERDFAARSIANHSNSCLNETIWVLNQFKAFAWISVCYAYTRNKTLQDLTNQDYRILQTAFTKKSPEFLEYHLKSFQRRYKNSRREWDNEQTEMLVEIIKEEKNEDGRLIWSKIAFRLFVKSDKTYYRTPQKCREKWFNHLSPEVNRDRWTLEQDVKLINCINKYGTKWALVSKCFQGSRTEHMIKNRYHSLIKQYKVRSLKHSQKRIVEKIMTELNVKVAQKGIQVQGEIMVPQRVEKVKIYEEKCTQVTEDQILEKEVPNLCITTPILMPFSTKLKSFKQYDTIFFEEQSEMDGYLGNLRLQPSMEFSELDMKGSNTDIYGQQYISSFLF